MVCLNVSTNEVATTLGTDVEAMFALTLSQHCHNVGALAMRKGRTYFALDSICIEIVLGYPPPECPIQIIPREYCLDLPKV